MTATGSCWTLKKWQHSSKKQSKGEKAGFVNYFSQNFWLWNTYSVIPLLVLTSKHLNWMYHSWFNLGTDFFFPKSYIPFAFTLNILETYHLFHFKACETGSKKLTKENKSMNNLLIISIFPWAVFISSYYLKCVSHWT